MHDRVLIISVIVYTTDSLKTLIDDSISPSNRSREKIGAIKALFAVLNCLYETLNHGDKWTASPKDLVGYMLNYARQLADSLDPQTRPVIRIN